MLARIPTFLFAAAVLVAVAPAQDDEDEVKDPKASAIKLSLSGSWLDLPEVGLSLASMFEGAGAKPKAFYDLIAKLEALAKPDDKRPILVDLSQAVGFNLAQMAELERAFAKVRAAGRQTWAYLEGADLVRYQVGALCDKVLLADMGGVDLRSLALSVTFMKDALDLLGVQMDVVRCGEFKGAVEPFMLPQMSEHLRAHYRAMVEKLNDDVVRRVAERRGLTREAVRKLQATRVLSAQEALASKLVDELVPWTGAERALKKKLGDDKLTFEDALSAKKKKLGINPLTILTELLNPKSEKKVDEDTLAVLHLSGEIADGDKAAPGTIVSGPTVKAIDDLAGNEHVKGVVVRVNSPGGSATASEAILLALRRLCAKKPVVVSMGYVAGSGGYYVTCLGRPILAEEGTITGSIGVFGMRPNLGALMRRVGIKEEIVGLDASAELEAIDRPWTDEQKAMLQKRVDEVYARFVGHVAGSRKLTREQVLAIAGGRVWSGRQAVESKLVDSIGGLSDALAIVAKETGVSASKVVHLPKPKSPLDSLLASFGGDSEVALPGLDQATLRLASERMPGLATLLAVLVDAWRKPVSMLVEARMEAGLVVR
jgi:protease-4